MGVVDNRKIGGGLKVSSSSKKTTLAASLRARGRDYDDVGGTAVAATRAVARVGATGEYGPVG